MNSIEQHKQTSDAPLAVVTGGFGAIGRAVGRCLAETGFRVLLTDREEAVARPSGPPSGIAMDAGGVMCLALDVTSEVEVGKAFESLTKRHGRLDVLVNVAGITRAEDVYGTELSAWQEVIAVNLTGAFLCSKAAMSWMRAHGGGRIINVASVVAHRGAVAGHAHYAASKSGMLGLTKTLARTGAPQGILVNAIAPGIIDTPLLRRTHGKGVAELTEGVPLGLGRPEDVGHAVAFLAGPGGRYITGTTLDVDGGMCMR